MGIISDRIAEANESEREHQRRLKSEKESARLAKKEFDKAFVLLFKNIVIPTTEAIIQDLSTSEDHVETRLANGRELMKATNLRTGHGIYINVAPTRQYVITVAKTNDVPIVEVNHTRLIGELITKGTKFYIEDFTAETFQNHVADLYLELRKMPVEKRKRSYK